MAKINNKIDLVPIMELIVNRELNNRMDYDIPSMKDQILRTGEIVEPVFVERGGKWHNTVLRGNRRILTAQELWMDPETPQYVKDAIERVKVIYVDDIKNDKERVELVFDQGGQKGLSKAETVRAIFRMFDLGYDKLDVAVMMYSNLAQYTGRLDKQHEVESALTKEARNQILKTWLHGTLDNYIKVAWSLGKFIREQTIISEMHKSRKLSDKELKDLGWKLWINKNRIPKLKKAANEDGPKYDPVKGGPAFNALVEQYHREDTGAAESEEKPPKRKTSSDISETVTGLRSRSMKNALLFTLSKQPEGFNIMDTDESIYAMELAMEECPKYLDKILAKHKEVKELVLAILYGRDPERLEKAFKPFCGK